MKKTYRKVYFSGYVCGPTLYKDNHIGNYKTYYQAINNFEVEKTKARKHKETNVLILNITDVNNKIYDIISETEGKVTEDNFLKFINQRVRTFIKHLKLLGLKPNLLAIKRVSFSIDNIKRNLRKLLKTGDIKQTNEGYKLSDPKYDSLGYLWKYNRDYPYFKGLKKQDPLGIPGWHIECASLISDNITKNVLQHYSGVDLKQIHNFNEEKILNYLRPGLDIKWTFIQPLLLESEIQGKLSKSNIPEDLELEKNLKYIPFFIKNYLKNTAKKTKAILKKEQYLKELRNSYLKPVNLKKRSNKKTKRICLLINRSRLKKDYKNTSFLKKILEDKGLVLREDSLRNLKKTPKSILVFYKN